MGLGLSAGPGQACVRYTSWATDSLSQEKRDAAAPTEHFLEAVCTFMQRCRVPGGVLGAANQGRLKLKSPAIIRLGAE